MRSGTQNRKREFKSICVLLGMALFAALMGCGASESAQVGSDRLAAIKHDLLNDHENGILVAAHRGHHISVPENSLASTESAIAIAADIVEMDVMLSKDGVPVLMHDDTVDRTTNGQGFVAEFTFQELKSLKLTDGAGEVTDMRIPSFREALEVARDQILIDVDLKADDIAPIVEVILDAGMTDQVMFYNSNPEVLSRVSDLVPDAIAMPIARSEEDVSEVLSGGDYRMLHVLETFNSTAIAEDLDKRSVASWTNALGLIDQRVREQGHASGFASVIANRPDVIQTDLPGELVAHLRELGLHWSSEE